MVNKDSTIRAKKAKQIRKIYELLGEYTQVICVTLENVGSLQCQQIRKQLDANNALLVIGKNTQVKKAVTMRVRGYDESDSDYDFMKGVTQKSIPQYESLIPIIKEKIGFIFSKTAVFELKPIIESNKVQAPAKVGQISNLDIVIPPGPTGMDPSQISFFHALQISTKIQKGQIEITKDYQVCFVGKKIGNSEVTLLQRMNLKPFSYQMEVFACYDNGAILGKDVIALSPSVIAEKFQLGVRNITAISMETGYQTQASIPYTLVNAFKNLAAIGMEVDYKFKQLANAASAAPAGGAAPAAGGKAAAQEEAPVEEEEEDMDMGGMFD